MKSEAEVIMRRKARRINKARDLVGWLEFDINHSEMPEKYRLHLLKTVKLLKDALKNDDKTECIWNRT
jgi:hypothetical protein